ncbi:MAG: hypothetical protein CM15mV25_1420 [uncultured marine virus]|nr:MAG: hypothetical protein CM15mV25_1420 [uncultured marine virus]
MVTDTIFSDSSFVSDCNNRSNVFNLNISFTCGSFRPIKVKTNKVINAIVQCVAFHILNTYVQTILKIFLYTFTYLLKKYLTNLTTINTGLDKTSNAISPTSTNKSIAMIYS